jgi:hypothetical protein
MITTRTRFALGVALLGVVLSLACTRAPLSTGPIPFSVTPSQSAALQPVTLEIAGSGFEARVQTDFDKSAGDVEARFAAQMEPVAGGAAVPLQEVTLTPRRTLQGIVPAGIPHGVYRLLVTDPLGRTGTLEQAFRVLASAESVSSFRVDVLEAPRAGVPFAVTVTAIDGGGSTVDGFEGSVALSDATGTVSPATLGPFVLGQLQAQVIIGDLASADQLVASDPLGHSGSSAPFDVVAGPPMSIVFPQAPVPSSPTRPAPRLRPP